MPCTTQSVNGAAATMTERSASARDIAVSLMPSIQPKACSVISPSFATVSADPAQRPHSSMMCPSVAPSPTIDRSR
jgi:hypothetical protein